MTIKSQENGLNLVKLAAYLVCFAALLIDNWTSNLSPIWLAELTRQA